MRKTPGSCLVCKGYIRHFEAPRLGKCFSCGAKEKTYILCVDDHYLCNQCASKKVMQKLYQILPTLTSVNPIDALETILKGCGICGNTPHPITAAAFLVAVMNATNKIGYDDVLEGVVRASQVPGGWCGYYGTCGAAVALGVAYSVIEKTTPMHNEERNRANAVTAAGLTKVAQLGGPRCCAASARVVLEKGIELAKYDLGIEFPERKSKVVRCWLSAIYPDCKKERCKFYSSACMTKKEIKNVDN